MTKIPIVPDYNLIAAEFALGRVLAVTPLAGGAPDAATMRHIAEYHEALRYRALRSVMRARPGLSALVSRLPADSSHSKRTN